MAVAPTWSIDYQALSARLTRLGITGGALTTALATLDADVARGLSDAGLVSYAGGTPPVGVSAAGRELASFVLATTLSGANAPSCIGPIGSLTDLTKDVDVSAFNISPVVATRPLLVEAHICAFFGTTGAYGVRLYDKTSGVCLDQDDRASASAFQIQAPANLRALVSPAPGARVYGIKVNGTAGTNNMLIEGSDNLCASWIKVTER